LAGIGLGSKGVSPWWTLPVSFGIALIFSIAVSARALWSALQPPGVEVSLFFLAVFTALIVLVPGFVVAQVAAYIGYRASKEKASVQK
jgi:hypothetical protein